MTPGISARSYHYPDACQGHHHAWLLPEIERVIHREGAGRIFDLGCGNGSVAAYFAARGYEVTGVDPSSEGIQQGSAAYPRVRLHEGSAYDELAERFGTFPIVLSLDVVEHLYSPRAFASTLSNLVAPSGLAIVSTPYHGYWKNLALALTGKLDRHWSPLWDHGHIKFWSITTLTELLRDAGFENISIRRLGRIPLLAKSMLAIARKRG